MADSTTNVGSPDRVMSFATSFMRSGLPTEVPPNFITFICLFYLIVVLMIGRRCLMIGGLFTILGKVEVVELVGDIVQMAVFAAIDDSRKLIEHRDVVG